MIRLSAFEEFRRVRGWRGPPVTKTRPVKGHEFGLDLSEEERRELIAFLKTL